jgi:flavin reductase (DIM6/NTAB) family NADH-FMN oxidoreductase RutF
MFYDAVRNDHGLEHDPIKAIIAPRPIGWISTLTAEGTANLAPYSFFNIVSESPHYVVFGSSGYKHTLANIQSGGEFAVNLVTHDLREAMNKTSGNFPSHIDEFAVAGLTKVQCEFIRVPRIAECLAALECKLAQTIPLPDNEGRVDDWLVLGSVLGVHIADSMIENGRVNTGAMRLVARLGYSEYITADNPWRLRRET